MEATKQMNIRMNASLKRSGERELTRRHVSPSEAIRAFYRLLVKKDEHSTQLIDEILEGDHASDADRAIARKKRLTEELFSHMESLRAEMGITKQISSVSEPSYEQLKEEAFTERFFME